MEADEVDGGSEAAARARRRPFSRSCEFPPPQRLVGGLVSEKGEIPRLAEADQRER